MKKIRIYEGVCSKYYIYLPLMCKEVSIRCNQSMRVEPHWGTMGSYLLVVDEENEVYYDYMVNESGTKIRIDEKEYRVIGPHLWEAIKEGLENEMLREIKHEYSLIS